MKENNIRLPRSDEPERGGRSLSYIISVYFKLSKNLLSRTRASLRFSMLAA